MDAVVKAKEILAHGGVVGIPTETVYGLAALIYSSEAIEKIFLIKERPFFDPLIVHVASIAQAKQVASVWGHVTEVLAETFWPGPLTLVLPKSPQINSMITSGLESVGIRMPNHPLVLKLITEVGVPLAAPSANKFGRTSPTSAQHVRDEFSKENVFVLDGGDCEIGIESTVVLVNEKSAQICELAILRPGHILKSDIEKALNQKNLTFKFLSQVDKKASPGHMKHHYMPNIPLILIGNASLSTEETFELVNNQLRSMPEEIENVRILKPAGGIRRPTTLRLSSDPVLATREFYGKLREAAQKDADAIFFYRHSSQVGERWEPLFDRMTKAASLVL